MISKRGQSKMYGESLVEARKNWGWQYDKQILQGGTLRQLFAKE
jgi:hypothetical protein